MGGVEIIKKRKKKTNLIGACGKCENLSKNLGLAYKGVPSLL